MSNILEVKDLNVSYGGIKAVKDISFAVPKGEVVTLIGANGAGKSSTLRSIVGLVKPESGSILLKGEELAGMPTEQIVTKGITLVPEGRRVFPDMTVAENLKIGAFMAGGRHPVRRRAADAGHRSRADVETGDYHDG